MGQGQEEGDQVAEGPAGGEAGHQHRHREDEHRAEDVQRVQYVQHVQHVPEHVHQVAHGEEHQQPAHVMVILISKARGLTLGLTCERF